MLSRTLAVVTAVLVGLLAGGMVLIEVVLVSFWRGAPAADFRDWFAAHSGRLRALMAPLGAAQIPLKRVADPLISSVVRCGRLGLDHRDARSRAPSSSATTARI